MFRQFREDKINVSRDDPDKWEFERRLQFLLYDNHIKENTLKFLVYSKAIIDMFELLSKKIYMFKLALIDISTN